MLAEGFYISFASSLRRPQPIAKLPMELFYETTYLFVSRNDRH